MSLLEEYKTARSTVPKTNFYKSFVPKIKLKDYKTGYIQRYFAKQSNNEMAHIVEISKKDFRGVNDFYKKTSIRWTITGKRKEVSNSNERAIKKAEDDGFKQLSLKLNSLEFWKDDSTPVQIKLRETRKKLKHLVK